MVVFFFRLFVADVIFVLMTFKKRKHKSINYVHNEWMKKIQNEKKKKHIETVIDSMSSGILPWFHYCKIVYFIDNNHLQRYAFFPSFFNISRYCLDCVFLLLVSYLVCIHFLLFYDNASFNMCSVYLCSCSYAFIYLFSEHFRFINEAAVMWLFR